MNKQDIEEILKEVTYKDNFFFVVGDDYIQVCENAKCNRTGGAYLSKGRKWKWSPFMVKSEIVNTAFKAVMGYEEHETREAFKFMGQSIYDPHYDVCALVKLRQTSGSLEVREEH